MKAGFIVQKVKQRHYHKASNPEVKYNQKRVLKVVYVVKLIVIIEKIPTKRNAPNKECNRKNLLKTVLSLH
jgi:hypothetical protein